MNGAVTPPDFEELYRRDADPWLVESSWYERRKRAVLLASLPRERYATGWEPGCGPGVTTVALAPRVDELVASDASHVAIGLARDRCAALDGVSVVPSQLPASPLDRPVDLVVAAEFLYYLPDLDEALETLWDACAPRGHLALLHWAWHPHDAYVSGPHVHAAAAATAPARGAVRLLHHTEPEFVLDIYEVSR